MFKQTQSFSTFVATQLNEPQRQAVEHGNGSLLVVAGAGSGKTRVITARIANLILTHNVPGSSIVALTFTNKAANEMKERIAHFLGTTTDLPFVGTFHSYCLLMLKKYATLFNLPTFTILDGDDQQKIINGIIQRNNLQKQVTARQAAYRISHLKNHAVAPGEKHPDADPITQEIYMAYEQEKTTSKCLDFDDLLLEVLKLFKKDKEFKRNFQNRVRHLLVDEYQDTNVVQHELLKQIAQGPKNSLIIDSLCAVGDEDQSIYSWRGATVSNIIGFTKDFVSTQIIKIEQNYRSVQPILTIANTVIKNNYNRNPKKLWSDKEAQDRVRTLSCLSEYQEADAVTNCIAASKKANPTATVAVLYRTHVQSRALEEALIKRSIPYKIIGGIQFYERKEIKDILAYLRLIVNPFDRVSFFRVVNCPLRGLGDKFEADFYERWAQEPMLTFAEMIRMAVNEDIVTGLKKSALLQFSDVFAGLTPTDAPRSAIEQILGKTGYITYLKKAYDEQEAQARADTVKELINAVNHLEDTKAPTLEQFLDEVALMQDHSKSGDEGENPVLMMTMHAAKGLEFDTVILPGLEEGLLPSSRSLGDTEALEEERRLFYVGITRARERLLFIYSRYRYSYGKMSEQIASRFMQEVPEHLSPYEDCSYWKPAQFDEFFAVWYGLKKASPQATVMTFGTGGSSSKTTSLSRLNTATTKPTTTFAQRPAVSAKPSYTPAQSTPSSSPILPGPWKKNQLVNHKTFGTGLVKEVEKKDDTTYYLTVSFKVGTKKIDAKFVEKA